MYIHVGKEILKVAKKFIFILVLRNEMGAKYLVGSKSSYNFTKESDAQ